MPGASNTLPAGWVHASLGEITAQIVRQAPPLGNTSLPYIDISSIDRDRKEIVDPQSIEPASAPTRARQWVAPGDVLVSMTRPNLNAVAIVSEALDGAVASTGFDVLRTIGVNPRWVYYRVRTDEFVADLCNAIQGVVYPAVRPANIRAHELPIPPLPEQRRIVAALDSHFSRLDAAVAALARVQRTLARYRASVLHAAVTGRLVPTEAELARTERREYEPASVLLARILDERRRRWEEAELAKMIAAGKAPKDDRWKARYVAPVGPATEELEELPEGWCWATVGQLSRGLRSGSSAVPADAPTAFPILRSSSIRPGMVDLENVRYLDHMSDERNFLNDGNLVFTRLSGSLEYVGNCAVVRGTLGRQIVYPDRVFCAHAMRIDIAEYIELCFETPLARKRIASMAMSTAGHQRVSMGAITYQPIPLPPLPELKRIRCETDRLTSTASETDFVTRRSAARLTRLRQSILRLAFEGRLVPQDPADEPAAALLARIRDERAARGSGPGRRQRRGVVGQERLM